LIGVDTLNITANNVNTNGTVLTLNSKGTVGVMAFQTASTERMRITSAGNVGIGTTSPGSRLEISGTTGSYDSGIGFVPSGTGARNYRTYIATDGSFNFDDATAGATRINISSTGNVGIGITTPGASITVGTQSSGSAGSGVAQDNSIIARFGASNAAARVTGATVANTATATIGNDATLSFIVAGSYSATGLISSILQNTTTAGTDMVFSLYNNTMQERMRITAAGNVGIGNANPGSRLVVKGVGTTTDTTLNVTNSSDDSRLLVVDNGNIGISVTSAFGNGVKVIGISNATTVPNADPSGGGVLYVEAGALKYRGSSGTITTIAPA
jgi:hypothetical protein